MAVQPSDEYPQIIMSGTDPTLPSDLTQGFTKYSQIRPMAAGGKAQLLACWDNLLGRSVAMKTLRPEYAQDETERRRFLREARVTAQLQHPNTVPVYEIGRMDDGGLYFTMKRLKGEDFYQVMSRLRDRNTPTKREYPLDRLIRIVIQVCQALAYAHSHGVIHRDVKPENIWLGSFGEVLVLDWGVAKVWGRPDEPTHTEHTRPPSVETATDDVEDSSGDLEDHEDPDNHSGDQRDRLETLTRSGVRPGTPLYMSPEQVAGHRYVDERTDVYSVGVLLYELTTSQLPFRAGSLHTTFDMILHEEPVPPTKKTPSRKVPPELEPIILKALKKDPRERQQSMLELISVLNQYLHGETQA